MDEDSGIWRTLGRLSIVLGIIVALITIIGIMHGQAGQAPSTPAPGSANGSTARPTSTPAPTDTPQATATPSTRTITEKLAIPVTSSPSGAHYAITLNSIVIDPSNGDTLLNLTVANRGAISCGNLYFYEFYMVDQDGTKYQAGGEGDSTALFSLGAGQSTELSGRFNFVAQSGMRLNLHLTLGMDDSCNTQQFGGFVHFQTESLSIR